MMTKRAPIIIQGMRRSSTTFLFDCLCAEDSALGIYEPLAKAQKTAVGGGSRVRNEDFFAPIRALRDQFAQHLGWNEEQLLRACNFGGPTQPGREFDEDFSPETAHYLRFIANADENQQPILKFTRAWRKASALADLWPEAVFLHIVRDPRAVVSSFLLGKGQKNRSVIGSDDAFFAQSRMADGEVRFAQGLCAHLGAEWQSKSDVIQLLRLWVETTRSTFAAQQVFQDRYLLVRHEDLLQHPEKTLARVYAVQGRELPESVLDWVKANLRTRLVSVQPQAGHWQQVFDQVRANPVLQALQYPHSGYQEPLRWH